MGLIKKLLRQPRIYRFVGYFTRGRAGFRYFQSPLGELFKWVFRSRERTNYTYDLTETNQRYLAAMLAETTGCPQAEIEGFIREIRTDDALRAHVAAETLRERRFAADADVEVRFGRRVGWYALARAIKPRVIIETGVDKGLGSCVLAAALRRNAAEGRPGRYFGTDINPSAGYLLRGAYAEHGRILYGDSITTLKAFSEPVDLFINDSDHSADYEAEEYHVIGPKLSPGAFIIGDNAHVTDRLLDYSLREGRSFLYFQEKPRDHWYPGGGIGLSFRRVSPGGPA